MVFHLRKQKIGLIYCPELVDHYNASFPDVAIQALVGFASQVKSGYFDKPSNDLASLLERNPISVSEFLKQTFAA
ncbi:hypothetical protein IFVP136_C290075 [Vibrio parahaemolyticus]